MGGRGSGGHNKKKENIEEYPCIDSFDLRAFYPSAIKKVETRAGVCRATYFVCPVCAKRVRFLYECSPWQYKCRTCIPANYSCQQMPRYQWAATKIMRILSELDVDTENFENMLEIIKFEPERPAYKMSEEEFERYRDELFKWKCVWHEEVFGGFFRDEKE